MKRRALLIAVPVIALTLTGILAVAGFSATQNGPLVASLAGSREIPNADPDGFGGFNATIDGSQFCYGLTAANIDPPVAAHVHRGTAGTNGPVVIPLTQPSNGDPGSSSDCVAADPALLSEIARNPSRFYVNVHTAAFPGGAIRGQLKRLG